MLILLSICFIAALFAPLVYRMCPKYSGALLMVAPLAMFLWLIKQMPVIMDGHSLKQTIPWVEKLGLELALCLDGLSLLFALLISGIGILILLYTLTSDER